MNYGSKVEQLSLIVAIVLIVSYVAGLLFSLGPTATCSTLPTRTRQRAGACAGA